ncbi:MAG: hypothetical protein ABJ004_17155 [Cyclobacteriaceae bacterium]
MNIVHIGYPKTATTFLQWEVFPRLENYNYIDYHSAHNIFLDLIYLDDLDYEEGKVRKLLSDKLREGDNLISYEALSGAPFKFKGLNRSNVPARLKALGFDKVIITVRDQVSILDSMYRQYVVQGGTMKFQDFVDVEGKWNPYLRSFNLSYLKYDRLVERYFDVFGRANVLILRQEWLKTDPRKFEELLCEFTGDKIEFGQSKQANQSLTNVSIKLLRVINHFTYNSERPSQLISKRISTKLVWKLFAVVLDPFFFSLFSSRKTFLTDTYIQFVKEYYRESNKRLESLISLNSD